MNVYEYSFESPAGHTEMQILEHIQQTLQMFVLTSEDFLSLSLFLWAPYLQQQTRTTAMNFHVFNSLITINTFFI
jgi:hypothetical protein